MDMAHVSIPLIDMFSYTILLYAICSSYNLLNISLDLSIDIIVSDNHCGHGMQTDRSAGPELEHKSNRLGQLNLEQVSTSVLLLVL